MAATPARLAVLLLLAGCGGSFPLGGSGEPLGSAPLDCVDYINSLRATKGLPALARWEDAETCANGQARSDSGSGEAHGAFGDCGEHAQDECPGWPGLSSIVPGCLDMMWAEGPGGGHYENMTSTQSTKVACGFYVTPGGSVWAVQDFR
jgi:hypothetical protein